MFEIIFNRKENEASSILPFSSKLSLIYKEYNFYLVFCIFLSESLSMRWGKEPWTDCWSLSHTQKCSPGTHVKENWANGCKFQNSCFNFAMSLQLQKMSNFTEVKKKINGAIDVLQLRCTWHFKDEVWSQSCPFHNKMYRFCLVKTY